MDGFKVEVVCSAIRKDGKCLVDGNGRQRGNRVVRDTEGKACLGLKGKT